MDNQRNSDEIDLKQVGKKVTKIFYKRKKLFVSLLCVIMIFALAYFVYVLIIPVYKSEVILKSKFVKMEQLESCFKKYNSYINAPNTNPINKQLGDILKKANILKYELSEINADPKDKDIKFRLYNLKILYSDKPNEMSEKALNMTIQDVQNFIASENEVIENKKRLLSGIIETDSLIKIAFDAGNNMKNRIQNNGQMLVMSDIYKSINDILTKKEIYQIELAFYNNENLVFKSSPSLISKKIEMPIIIFVIAFFLWAFIVGVYITFDIIFKDEE
jgi:hypothetical protein